MKSTWLLLPVIVQWVLVFVVQITMYRQRVSAIRAEKVHLGEIATRTLLEQRIPQANATSDNFKNQFELPVLFYAVIGFFMITGWAGWLEFYLASGFVIMRILHARIHCTSNQIKHRFMSYVIGSWILMALVISFMVHWWIHTF